MASSIVVVFNSFIFFVYNICVVNRNYNIVIENLQIKAGGAFLKLNNKTPRAILTENTNDFKNHGVQPGIAGYICHSRSNPVSFYDFKVFELYRESC